LRCGWFSSVLAPRRCRVSPGHRGTSRARRQSRWSVTRSWFTHCFRLKTMGSARYCDDHDHCCRSLVNFVRGQVLTKAADSLHWRGTNNTVISFSASQTVCRIRNRLHKYLRVKIGHVAPLRCTQYNHRYLPPRSSAIFAEQKFFSLIHKHSIAIYLRHVHRTVWECIRGQLTIRCREGYRQG
jgi:hypothetical protein